MQDQLYQFYTLSNGLRIVHKEVKANVSYCGFIVNVGTRDESADEHGMAHFIEHMLFKGTKKRKSYHILNRMESVGGELNAYTNKEETVIYSIFLEEHFGRAFELLTDIVFNSTFHQNEIEKERDVIIDEIHSYEDNPSELIFDEYENLIFEGSQIGHNILGEPSTLYKFESDSLKDFTRKYYTTNNIVFFSVGNTSFKQVQKLADKILSGIQEQTSLKNRIVPLIVDSQQQIVKKSTSQVHAILGSRSYSLFDDKKRTLYLLNNILGGSGMNSRLNMSLREKKGYVYNVESSQTLYTDSGIFGINFSCDKKNMNNCINLVHRELKKMMTDKLSTYQLSAAKKQLLGQMGIDADNNENTALSMAKSILHYGHYNSFTEVAKKIDSISAFDLLEVANEIFDEKNMSSLIYS